MACFHGNVIEPGAPAAPCGCGGSLARANERIVRGGSSVQEEVVGADGEKITRVGSRVIVRNLLDETIQVAGGSRGPGWTIRMRDIIRTQAREHYTKTPGRTFVVYFAISPEAAAVDYSSEMRPISGSYVSIDLPAPDPLADPAKRAAYYGLAAPAAAEAPTMTTCRECQGTGGDSQAGQCRPCRGSGSVRRRAVDIVRDSLKDEPYRKAGERGGMTR